MQGNWSGMQVTVLGCGTSTGVPLIGCVCSVCLSCDSKNQRLRASVWLQSEGKSLLLDTSTDLRQQALRERIERVDAVLYTHPHADHIAGIDELRSFNFLQNERIPAYGNRWTCEELKNRYPYIFEPTPVEGGGIPLIDLHLLTDTQEKLVLWGKNIGILRLWHGTKECLGFRFGPFAYVTDCQEIPEMTLDKMQGLEVLVLDCLRLTSHPTHLNLEKALAVIERIKPRRTYLTHMGHDLGYEELNMLLPKTVQACFDGMKILV